MSASASTIRTTIVRRTRSADPSGSTHGRLTQQQHKSDLRGMAKHVVINEAVQERDFFADVMDVVRQIPRGRVTSYGAIAKYLGAARSARKHCASIGLAAVLIAASSVASRRERGPGLFFMRPGASAPRGMSASVAHGGCASTAGMSSERGRIAPLARGLGAAAVL